MYYKVLAKVKTYNKSHIFVVDACSNTDAREKAWDYIRNNYPTWKVERMTVSGEWIWDVIL